MQENYRHEYKHEINHADYIELRSRLLAVARIDPHADGSGRYMIRSLYFDDPCDRALFEKLDGVNRREKFRIRYYNRDTDGLMLEKKSKLNGLCMKNASPITREMCARLICGDTECLKGSPDPLITEFYIKHRQNAFTPKALVTYTREPYIYPAGNVRVTFDSNIRAGVDPRDFLDPDAATLPAAPGMVILEVKYDRFLPDIIRDILQQNRRHAAAFSKYAACRSFR